MHAYMEKEFAVLSKTLSNNVGVLGIVLGEDNIGGVINHIR